MRRSKTLIAQRSRKIAGLQASLDQAEADSRLADRPTAEPALHDLLVRARLG
jgi:hypothetical protein